MVKRAQHNGLLCGLAENLIPRGVAILQYANDIIICLKNDFEKARNMKLLLYLYEVMSGLKINFSKSEIILVNGDNDTQILYAELFNCQAGLFPIKYLEVLVGPGRLHIKDWVILQEKNLKKLSTWKGSSLSMAGRLTLACPAHLYIICPCISYPKQQLILWINREGLSFGKEMDRKENIILFNGRLFAKIKTKEAWASKI